MNTITCNFIRIIAMPAMIVAAALILADLSPAAPTAPAPVGPGYQCYADIYAPPPPSQVPGWAGGGTTARIT